MPNMEKVIRIIDELIFEAQKEPKWKAENALRCLKKELLKEQEAVKPVEVNNKETGCFKCGNCGAVVLSYSYPGIITDKYRSYHQFCGKCGRRVLWEGQ